MYVECRGCNAQLILPPLPKGTTDLNNVHLDGVVNVQGGGIGLGPGGKIGFGPGGSVGFGAIKIKVTCPGCGREEIYEQAEFKDGP